MACFLMSYPSVVDKTRPLGTVQQEAREKNPKLTNSNKVSCELKSVAIVDSL